MRYDPLVAPEPGAWLALPEEERLQAALVHADQGQSVSQVHAATVCAELTAAWWSALGRDEADEA